MSRPRPDRDSQFGSAFHRRGGARGGPPARPRPARPSRPTPPPATPVSSHSRRSSGTPSLRSPVLGRLGGRPTPTARPVSGGGPPLQLPRDPGQPPERTLAGKGRDPGDAASAAPAVSRSALDVPAEDGVFWRPFA